MNQPSVIRYNWTENGWNLEACDHDWRLDGSGGAECTKCGGLLTVPSEVDRLLAASHENKANG
jgi:hypothetical protein